MEPDFNNRASVFSSPFEGSKMPANGPNVAVPNRPRINYMTTVGNPCLRGLPDTNWQGNCHITASDPLGL
jgi:hypothetical protein